MKKRHFTMILSLLLISTPGAYADTLESVINKTLQTNPEIQASQSHVHASQQQLEQAKSGYYPTVDFMAGYGREASENISTGFEKDTLTRQELVLEIRQNLFQGYATESETARQSAILKSADHGLSSDKEAVALRVAEAYINVIRHREVLLVAQDFVKSHQVIYKKIEKRSASGVGRKAERVHAAGRLALSRSNLTMARSNLDEVGIAYLAVVGEMPPATMSLPDKSNVSNSLEEALQYAKQNNPAIASADADVEAAMQGRRVSNSEFYPAIDLVVSGSRNEDIDGVVGDDDDQSIMLQLKYNLYSGGGDTANKQRASHELARAKFIRDNAHRIVEQRIRSAWNELQSRDIQLDSLKQHLDSSIKTRGVYADQYRIGKRTLLDLLDTENELMNARVNYLDAIHDRLIAQYKLQAYMGLLTAGNR